MVAAKIVQLMEVSDLVSNFEKGRDQNGNSRPWAWGLMEIYPLPYLFLW
jgi:hypothetical protein